MTVEQTAFPPQVVEAHKVLQEWGVVRRIQAALLRDKNTVGIANLICWFSERPSRSGLYVAATFTRTLRCANGRQSRPFLDGACFRVTRDKSFGPHGEPPLPIIVVDAIELAAVRIGTVDRGRQKALTA